MRIKYAAIGWAMWASSSLAFVGWTHQAWLVAEGSSWRFAAPLIGAAVACALFSLERVLIVTLRPGLPWGWKMAALAWRGAVAFFFALVVAIPLSLDYLDGRIGLTLDEESRTLKRQAQHNVVEIYDVPGLSGKAANIAAQITTNRANRDVFPPEVKAAVERSTACRESYMALQGDLDPKIAEASAARDSSPSDGENISERAARIDAQVRDWKIALTFKRQSCAAFANQAIRSMNAYHKLTDEALDGLQLQQHAAISDLQAAIPAASSMSAKSQAAIDRSATADLGGRVHGLFELLRKDWVAFAMFLIAFFPAYMLDLMPVIAKLSTRKDESYSQAVQAQEEIYAADAAADIAVAKSLAEMRKQAALAEEAGFARFCEEGQGAFHVARARERASYQVHAGAILGDMEIVDAIMDAYDHKQQHSDELERKYRHHPDAAENLQQIAAALRAALTQTLQKFKDHSQVHPAE